MKRNATLPRHSKSLLPNFRIPRPLCTCGRPNVSGNSHSANRHSIRSLLAIVRKRRSTAGSIDRGLLKHLPQLLGGGGHQSSRPFEPAIMLVGSLLKHSDLLLRRPVFALRIIYGFHLDFAQGDDVGPADDPDILPVGRSIKPAAQILLGVRNRESLHRAFIKPPKSFVNTLDGFAANRYRFFHLCR